MRVYCLRSSPACSPWYSQLIFIEATPRCVPKKDFVFLGFVAQWTGTTMINMWAGMRPKWFKNDLFLEFFFFLVFIRLPLSEAITDRAINRVLIFYSLSHKIYRRFQRPGDLTNKPKFIVLWETRNKSIERTHGRTLLDAEWVTRLSRPTISCYSNVHSWTSSVSAAIICFLSFFPVSFCASWQTDRPVANFNLLSARINNEKNHFCSFPLPLVHDI